MRNTAVIVMWALIAACGSARVVHRTQYGGIIALQGDRGKAMEEARRIMWEHCGGQYTIVEEGEHVVGTETRGGSETYVTEDGTEVTEGGESTHESTEWRVKYQCGQAPPPPAAAPPPAEPPPPPVEPGY